MNSNLLETPRLKIHIASDEEIRSLIAAQRDDALKAAYTEMFKGSAEHPDARKWYAPWIIELKDGTHVGELCFMGPPSGGAVEIGYGISEEYRNRGYASEAVKALSAWALDRPGVAAVEAETEPGNRASQRVLAKAGFIPTGTAGKEGPRYRLSPERK
ncbi:MAG: GNAT family N-acetyltransferase [Abditibacteriota bacterium]|nr:GNAT family N-acetyltransferase [Abditibacteriota bacterium]